LTLDDNMRTLYIDCRSGASKDILFGALADILEDPSVLGALSIPGAVVSAETSEGGLHVTIDCGENDRRERYTMDDVNAIIDAVDVPQTAKTYARGVFRLIAEAESKAHRTAVSDVHFHEVGRPSDVLYVIGSCFAISMIKPDRIISTPIRTGRGEVMCAHGILSIPAPATANLLKKQECYPGDADGEFCTPTGAALIGYFAGSFGDFPDCGTVGCGTAPRGYAVPFRCRVAITDEEI
jgi:pyridinium-3,5-bisthiocarboxylic acid mononucleotide nickel chelatase